MSDSLLGGEQTPPEQTPEPTPTPTPSPDHVAPEWMQGIEGIPEDIIGDPSLKAVKDIPNLIKSFVHAQKMMGKDKIVVPDENADADAWNEVFSKLGKPADLESYTLSDIEDSVYDKDYVEDFKKTAYELNILPSQAQKLLETLNAKELEANEHFKKEAETRVAEGINTLKTEWGQAFQDKVNSANRALKEFGGEEMSKYMQESGLGNDPQLVRLFAKIGEKMFGEDGGATSKQARQTPAAMTPEEAKRKYASIINDPTDDYHHSGRAGHMQRAQEVAELFKYM